MIASWKDLIDVPLMPREGAVVLLACLEVRGVNLWLDADGRLCWDFTRSDAHPDEYAEGLRLLRDEFRNLLHERELREAVMRSRPAVPEVVQ